MEAKFGSDATNRGDAAFIRLTTENIFGSWEGEGGQEGAITGYMRED